MHKVGEHAVVLGASMGGLLAARVLADAYERVTVVERDRLPSHAEDRRGVPQGRHAHGLLAGGAHAIEELMPGLLDELVRRGAWKLADFSRLHFVPDGEHRVSAETEVEPIFQSSRPLLEAGLRWYVRDLPNVEVLDGHDVVGLEFDEVAQRIVGARIAPHTGGSAQDRLLAADLVVDAMGRAARTPAWLEAFGYGRPVEEQIVIDVRYTSQLVRLPAGSVPETLTVIGTSPQRPRGMALIAYEDDVWVFTTMGFKGHYPEPDAQHMVEFIADFAPQHMVDALRRAEPLTDIATFRFPANRRRRYDKMRAFPQGLLVFGDAMCSFNPIYGQGMSVAAIEALALRDCLRHGDRDLPRRFFKAAAKPIEVAWQMATGADLAMPDVEGPRPLPVRLVNAYVRRVIVVAEKDPVVAARLLKVSAFVEKPPRLMTPAMMARVAVGMRRARRTVAAEPVPALADA